MLLFLFAETYAVFKLLLYKTLKDLETKSPIACGSELEFINTDNNETMVPIFIIYSYDSRIEKSNYQKLAQKNIKMRQPELSTGDIAATTPQPRRKRSDSSDMICHVKPLIVRNSEIHLDLFSISPSYPVLLPRSYNAGICGGVCRYNLPGNKFNKHALLIHHIIHSQNFKNRELYAFTQCCSPVNYRPLTVLYHNEKKKAIETVIIPNAILDACDCIDVVKPPY